MPASADELPRVSILMPMRNAAPYVEQALRSVLIEKEVPLEVIVTDDGSTDASRQIIELLGDPRVRVIEGPCQGIAAAFNAALEAAQGEIVMRCDADDIYSRARIARQTLWLRANGNFGAICGGFAAIDGRGRAEMPFGTPNKAEEITAELQAGLTRTHLCTFAVRAKVLRITGGMRSYFLTGEDIDLQLRIGETCRVWYSPEIDYCYRIHNASITHTRHVKENLFFENLAREFQVQRRLRGADDLSIGKPPMVPYFGAAQRDSAKSHIQDLLIGRTWAAVSEGNYHMAITYALRGAGAKPASITGWRNLVILLTKLAAARLLPKHKR